MERNLALPPLFEKVFLPGTAPAHALSQVVRLTGEALQADRCFLYVRKPDAEKGRIAFCWCRDNSIPDVTQPDWQDDTGELPQEDPLFAAALAGKPSVYVNDVETAPPDVLNRAFEARTFGHRALIHAHIVQGGKLWGILQPCVFGQPHAWSEHSREIMERLAPQLVPVVQAYVASLALTGK